MAKDFENAKTHNGIHYSRYIASWKRKGGKLYTDDDALFIRWLREKEQLTEEEISDIRLLVTNGKMELERSAEKFLDEEFIEAAIERNCSVTMNNECY